MDLKLLPSIDSNLEFQLLNLNISIDELVLSYAADEDPLCHGAIPRADFVDEYNKLRAQCRLYEMGLKAGWREEFDWDLANKLGWLSEWECEIFADYLSK